MKVGRKPTPSKLKIVTARDRPDRMPKQEPTMPIGNLPQPPKHLDAQAMVEWERVSAALYSAGVLSEIDSGGLAMYCQCYSRWKQAEQAIQKLAEHDTINKGLMIETTNGNFVQNPMVGTANVAMRDAMKYASEYGLTPSSRVRLGIEADNASKNNPAAQYFN